MHMRASADRRGVGALLLCVATATATASASTNPLPAKPMTVVVGMCGGDVPAFLLQPAAGDDSDGTGGPGTQTAAFVPLAGPIALGPRANWIAAHPTLDSFYAISGTASAAAVKFKSPAGPGSFHMQMQNNVSGVGSHIVHMTTDAAGDHLLVAGYNSGSLSLLEIQRDGSLGQLLHTAVHRGQSACNLSTPAGSRQLVPHVHSVNRAPDGKNYYVADLGLDRVYQYQVQGGQLVVQASTAMGTCSGPRHMAFHPAQRYAYVLHEMASTLTVHRLGGGAAALSEALQTVRMLPPGWGYCRTVPLDGRGNCSKAAEVRITSDGRWLYASNRGHNTIVRLPVHASGAKLGPVVVAAEATWARGMALSPDSKYLVLATDQGADAAADVSDLNGRQGGASSAGVTAGFVVAYAVDGATGALTEAARTSLPTGCDITFL